MEAAAPTVLRRQVTAPGRVALRVVAAVVGSPAAQLAPLTPQRANAGEDKDDGEDNAPETRKQRHKGMLQD